jgi:predicted HicB family RNase H-like nuclease
MTAAESPPWTQLATRIPKTLHRNLKLYCVTTETSVMAFVVDAIQEKLRRDASRAPRRAKR